MHATPSCDEVTLTMSQWEHHRNNIAVIVLESDQFIVFLDKANLDVDWETTTEKDHWLREQNVSPSDASSAISYLESLPSEHLKPTIKRAFRCQLGEAMVYMLRGEPKKSAQIIEKARQYYTARCLEYGRRSYAISSTVAASISAVCATGISLYLNRASGDLGNSPVIHVGVGASLGTIFFSLTRMNHLEIDPDAEQASHIVEAISRVLVGLIVSVVAVCAVKGGFLFPQIIKDGFGYFLLCFVAGSSERFAGTIVENLDRIFTRGASVDQPSGKKSADRPRRGNSA